MKVICGKLSGFCAGVNYTVNKALETLKTSDDKIYCLGEIVHNERVINDLEGSGMITVNDIGDVPNNSKVIIRAHGEAKEVLDSAKSRNIETVDLTCGKIKLIIKKIEKEKDDSYIIIIGKKNHPETLCTISYAGNNSSILENSEDIISVYDKFKETSLKKVYIVSQTTFSSLKFDNLVEEIKYVFEENVDVVVDKTICDATEKRQEETAIISKSVDKMIIIGGKNSSNTKELANIAMKNCNDTYLIQNVDDLKDILFDKDDKIGVMAGASTPRSSIDEVIAYLESI